MHVPRIDLQQKILSQEVFSSALPCPACLTASLITLPEEPRQFAPSASSFGDQGRDARWSNILFRLAHPDIILSSPFKFEFTRFMIESIISSQGHYSVPLFEQETNVPIISSLSDRPSTTGVLF